MSRITIHNYEAFLLDMAEGTITPADHEALLLFLAAHPNLDIDLDGIAYATLEADGIYFPDKENLKKTAADTSRFDELAVKQIEEGLSVAEETELQKLLAATPALAFHLAAYSQTKLQPNLAITFAGKDALKQDAIVKPFYYALAAAASVALLVGAAIFFNNQNTTQTGFATNGKLPIINPPVAIKNKTIDSASVVKQPVVTSSKNNTNNVAVYQPKSNIKQPEVIAPVASPEKETLVAVNNTPLKLATLNTASDNETVMAPAPLPIILAIPTNDPGLLATLWGGAKNLLKKSVNDEEVSARIDTLGERGFQWGDLAFFGGKGIQKITGKKPNIGVTQKGDGSSSAINIGRYTFVAKRKAE